MRSRSSFRWLLGGISLTACAASPGPVEPADGATTTSSAAPVATVTAEPTASATATATTSASATATAAVQDTGCFAKPVTLVDKRDKAGDSQPRVAQAVDAGLPGKLAACASAADPEECKVGIGKVYLDANRFEDAGPIFLDVAMNGKTGAAAAKATMLYLECLNVLGGEALPPRLVCYDDMAAKVGPLKARHCATPSKETKEVCAALGKIEDDLVRLKAEELIKKAQKSGDAGDPALYRQAGDVYMGLFNRKCAFHRPDVKKKPVAPEGWTADNRCDEIVYNAMLAYLAAHEIPLAQAARAALLDPDNRLNKSPLADKAKKREMR